jgi:hypothetical protein
VGGLLVVVVGFLAPAIVGPIYDAFEVDAFFMSIAAAAMMQIVLFMFFFYFLLFPISYTLKDVRTEEYEIFLSAPVKPGEVLLGKFMGAMPFYAIAIAVITGFFTAFLLPLGIDMAQVAIIIIVFVVTLLSAVWIGTVIAATLRTKLGRTARGKDIAKALPLILAIPMVAVMYAIMGGGLIGALMDPNTSGAVRAALFVIPSSWGAELIVLFASNPGDIGSIWLETLALFGGLILFFLTSLWVGAKAADRAYSLEITTFTAAKAKPDGAFYRTVESLGGGKSFGKILVSVFKDYGRRFQNLSKIGYIIGLLVLISIFFVMDRDEPGEALIQGVFFFPFLSGFVVGEVTIRGKENLFLYRKAPGGEGRLIKARLVQSSFVILPIAAVYSIVSLVLVPKIDLLSLLAYTGIMILIVTAYVTLTLGLFLLRPVFTDKPAEMMGNLMMVMMASIFVFIAATIIVDSFLGALLLMTLIFWMSGILLLYLGKRNLNRIE